MSLLEEFVRVTKTRPCPVCGRPDWCLVSRADPEDPALVICPRTVSSEEWGTAGYLHRLRPGSAPRPATRVSVTFPDERFATLAARWQLPTHSPILARAAKSLGVGAASLARLGVGAVGEALAFPMRDAKERVLGLALRFPDGLKRAVRGSRAGLFLPTGLQRRDLLLIAEGPTDTAALLSLGFDSIGRPGCRGGAALVRAFVCAHAIKCIAVVGDGDEPGTQGAHRLARELCAFAATTCVIVPPPPIKDAREWLKRGARHSDIHDAIGSAPRYRASIGLKGKQ